MLDHLNLGKNAMRDSTFNTGIVFCLIAFGGCTQNAGPSTSHVAPAAETPNITSLENRITTLETKLKLVSSAAYSAQYKANYLNDRFTFAEFDPSQATFQRIDTDDISFAVSISDISQFGDSTRVKLDLGNLSSASVASATLHLTYGPRAPDSNDAWVEWQNNLKKKDVDTTAILAPGSWNPTVVVLPGMEAKKFGYLMVAMDVHTLQLHK